MSKSTNARNRSATLAHELAGESRLALGCMGIAGTYGIVEESVARSTLMTAFDGGVRLFDTAPLYGNGLSEDLIGGTLGRKSISVITKFGLAADRKGSLIVDSRPTRIRTSVDSSLRRLRRDRIDVLLQHRHDPKVPDEDVAEVLLRLIEEGKVSHAGLSHSNILRMRKFQTYAPINFVQNELSIASPPDDGEAPDDFAKLGVVFTAHSPLARGILVENSPRHFKDDDYRSKMRSLSIDDQLKIIQLAKSRRLGNDLHDRVAKSLEWVISRGKNTIAVVGARSPGQVREILSCSRRQPPF